MIFLIAAFMFTLMYPYITKRNALEAPLGFSLFAIIILLMSALMGELIIGYWLFIAIIFLGFLTIFVSNYKKFINFIVENKLNYLICGIFCGLLALIPLIINDNYRFSVWDEFSFWGTSIKYIYEANALPIENSALLFKRYPVGQQMFQFFVLKNFGWSEKNVLTAQLLLIGSSILFIAAQFSDKFIGQLCCVLCVIFISLISGLTFNNIYADLLLAILFTAAIAMALKLNLNIVELVLLSAICIVLTQIKELGILFVCIVVSLTSAQIVMENTYFSRGDLLAKARRMYFPLTLVMLALLAHYVWTHHITQIGEPVPALKHSIAQLLSGPGLIRLGATLTTLFQKFDLVTNVIFIYISIVIVSLYCYFEIKRAIFFFILLFSYIFYIIVLLYLYLFVFSEYEGVRLASFERYNSTFAVGMLAIALLDLMFVVAAKLKDKYFIAPILFAVFLFLAGSPSLGTGHINLAALNIKTKLDRAGVYDRCLHLSKILKKYADASDKFFYVSQRSNGYDVHVCNYHTVPFKMPLHGPWSFGKPDPSIPDDDLYTFDKDLMEILKSYEWLVVFRSDDEFRSKYENLFVGKGKEPLFGVYRVDKLNGNIKLHMVE